MIGYLMAHAVQKTQPAVALALPDLLLYFHKTFLPFFVTFFLTFFLSCLPSVRNNLHPTSADTCRTTINHANAMQDYCHHLFDASVGHVEHALLRPCTIFVLVHAKLCWRWNRSTRRTGRAGGRGDPKVA